LAKLTLGRYASLFSIAEIEMHDNELIIHRYVEVLDRYFGNAPSPYPASLLGPY